MDFALCLIYCNCFASLASVSYHKCVLWWDRQCSKGIVYDLASFPHDELNYNTALGVIKHLTYHPYPLSLSRSYYMEEALYKFQYIASTQKIYFKIGVGNIFSRAFLQYAVKQHCTQARVWFIRVRCMSIILILQQFYK